MMAVVWESLWSNFNRETFNKLYKSEIAYLKILLNSRNIFGMTFLFCLQFLFKIRHFVFCKNYCSRTILIFNSKIFPKYIYLEFVLSNRMFSRFLFRIVMVTAIFSYKRCSVRLYYQLFYKGSCLIMPFFKNVLTYTHVQND